MPELRKLNDLELSALTDEELVEYIGRARDAGEVEAMRLAIAIFSHGMYADVRSRVAMRMSGRSEADIEIVTANVLESAMLANFRGTSTGELRALLTRIIQRRVADYFRSSRGQASEAPLASEHAGEPDIWGEIEHAPDELSAVWAGDLLERSLSELSPAHRVVVEYRLAGYSSRETADLVNHRLEQELRNPMTPENVDQIQSRFRRRHRDLLREAERGGHPGKNEREGDDG
jgi:DNA-directed RNA polymerase specialized sigma24 family protein